MALSKTPIRSERKFPMVENLSKREWYAGLALQGLMSQYRQENGPPLRGDNMQWIVQVAWRAADLMLTEAKNQPKAVAGGM